MPNLGPKLKQAREICGMDPIEVCDKMGWHSPDTLLFIEIGKVEPCFVELVKLAEIYYRMASEFMTDEPLKTETVIWCG